MMPQWSPQAMENIIFKHQIECRLYGEGETFVMVEGKTDEVFWEEFSSRKDCTIYPVNGKDRVVATLDIANKNGTSGVAGVVDADYWLLADAEELCTKNLLFDNRCPDLEMILLQSPALKMAMRCALNGEEIDTADRFTDTLYTLSQKLAAEFGYFRLLNELEDYGINFKKFNYRHKKDYINFRDADFIDVEKLQLRHNWTATRLAGSSQQSLDSGDLLQEIAALKQKYSPGAIQLCRGKDVLAIMAYIAPRVYQQHFDDALPESARELFDEARLAKELRKAYEYIYFVDTSLYQRIRDWQCANHPFRIIRDFPVPG